MTLLNNLHYCQAWSATGCVGTSRATWWPRSRTGRSTWPSWPRTPTTTPRAPRSTPSWSCSSTLASTSSTSGTSDRALSAESSRYKYFLNKSYRYTEFSTHWPHPDTIFHFWLMLLKTLLIRRHFGWYKNRRHETKYFLRDQIFLLRYFSCYSVILLLTMPWKI